MEDKGIVRQPLLKNGHVGTMDDKDTEGDLTFEDTPAPVALRDVHETSGWSLNLIIRHMFSY